jgi:hypothetical protein
MRGTVNRLLVRRFAHDPQGVLTTVHWLTLVNEEQCFNLCGRVWQVGFELSVAPFTYADGWRRGFLYDPQFALRHDCSLAHWTGKA